MFKTLAIGTVAAIGIKKSAMRAARGQMCGPHSAAAPGTTGWAPPSSAHPKDIVDTAVAAGSFKTLATALTAAGLVATLKAPGPFTVFAPTDEAFARLPEGTVENLLKPENKAKLTRILTAHVVAGKVMAADVVKLKSATAVSGDPISIRVAGQMVLVDGAKVTTADVAATNGVIHVIDTVILPRDH